jgi:hypothetical protein
LKWSSVFLGWSLTACGYVGIGADDRQEQNEDLNSTGASNSLGLGGEEPEASGGEEEGSGGKPAASGGSEATGGDSSGGDAAAGGTEATGGEGTGGEQAGDFPLISSLVESFDHFDSFAEAFTTKIRGDGCKADVSGGRIKFSMVKEVLGRCEITSAKKYDLRDGAVAIQIPGIAKFYPEMRVFFAVTGENAEDRIELSYQNNQFQVLAIVGGENRFSDSVTYLTTYNFWRMRDEGSSILVEVSESGDPWEVISKISPSPFVVSPVRVNLGVEVLSAMEGNVDVSVLGVNTVE